MYCQNAGVLAFTFTFTSDELGDTFDGVDLNQFAMQQMVGQQESHFTTRPPKPGVYQLVIYVKVALQLLLAHEYLHVTLFLRI